MDVWLIILLLRFNEPAITLMPFMYVQGYGNCISTVAEIKKQYRKLVTEYHPDKIESKGLPEEFIKFANDKFIIIQEAYDHIKRERRL